MTPPIMSSKIRRRVRWPRRHESRATLLVDRGTTTSRPRVRAAGWRGAINSIPRRQRSAVDSGVARRARLMAGRKTAIQAPARRIKKTAVTEPFPKL